MAFLGTIAAPAVGAAWAPLPSAMQVMGESPQLGDMAAQIMGCLGHYLCYVAPAALALLAVRSLLPVPRELFRKLLQGVAFCSAPVVMWHAESWRVASLTLTLFGVLVWPLLYALEGKPWYAGLFIERHAHEVRRSLLLLFLGNAAIVALCWGAFTQPALAVAAILMWGVGDATAALVGKRWGRHHVLLSLADHRKTWEGSLGMFVASLLVGTGALAAWGHLPVGTTLVRAMLTAALSTYVELVTKGGYDTLTVPVANAAALLVLTFLG